MPRGEYRFCIVCAIALGVIALLMAMAQPPSAKAQFPIGPTQLDPKDNNPVVVETFSFPSLEGRGRGGIDESLPAITSDSQPKSKPLKKSNDTVLHSVLNPSPNPSLPGRGTELIQIDEPIQNDNKQTRISFIHDIAPILKENCLACHDTKKKNGKLDMSSFAKLRKGGTNDDPIVPGQPDESELVRLITATDEHRMPPPEKGQPLSKEKVQLIRQWIKEGATLDPTIEPIADLLREVRKRWQPPLPPETYPAPVAVNAVAFTPDYQQLVVGGYFELIVWNLDDKRIAKRIRTRSERTYALAFLPNGLLAAAGGRPGQEGDVRIYDINGPGESKNGIQRLDGVRDPRVLKAHLFDTDDCELALAVSNDKIAAGGCDRMARVWDISELTSPKLLYTIAIHADWIHGVAFTTNGEKLLTASRDKTAKLFDLNKQETAMTFSDHQATVNGVAVRKDGQVAYSVGADKMLWFWTLTTDKTTKKRVTGHSDEVAHVMYHPSAPLVITASADKSVRVWRDDGNPVKTLSGLTEAACGLAISSDGKLVAAGATNGEVVVWRLPEGKVLTTFKAVP